MDRGQLITWNYNVLESWEGRLMEGALGLFPDGVLHELRQVHANVEWFKWLDVRCGKERDCVSRFADLARRHFGAIRGFHATRLQNIDQLRAEGLRAWTAEELEAAARSRYPAEKHGAEAVERAIQYANARHRAGTTGRVYFFSVLRHALSKNVRGAWLRYGGEFQSAVGVLLGVSAAELEETMKGWRPYVIACDLAIEAGNDNGLEIVWEDALTTLLVRHFGLPESELPICAPGSALSSERTIHPSEIIEVAEIPCSDDEPAQLAKNLLWVALN